MRIVWDEPKRLANLFKHKMDFAELTPEFFDHALIRPARGNWLFAFGVLDDGTIAVVFTRLGTQGVLIISMRPANASERSLYEQARH